MQPKNFYVKKFFRISKFALPFWKFYLLLAILSFVGQLLGLVSPYLSKIFFDDVLINQQIDLFFLVLFAMLGVYLGSGIFNIVKRLVEQKLSQKQVTAIQLELFNHIQKAPLDLFHKLKVGDIMNRISGDAGSIQSLIQIFTGMVAVSTITLAVTVFITITLSPLVTIVVLSVIPFYLFSELFWVKKQRQQSKDYTEKYADVTSFLQEAMSSVKVIKTFARERFMKRQYETWLEDLNETQLSNVKTSSVSGFVSGFVAYLPSFLVLTVGGYQVLEGTITIGALIALQLYASRLFLSVSTFVSLHRVVQMTMVGADRVFEILDERIEKDDPEAKAAKRFSGDIEIRNLSYQHQPGMPILENISGTIQPGQHIGLVGRSGAGKSTLVNLLFRFYQPNLGGIYIDGRNIKKIKLESLRSRIGFVTQETIIFNRTIRENLAFSKPGATQKEIEYAARVAGIDQFIESLPEGYDTKVGERGELLSGGQRQRLSLARVILEDPDIIIFDEPTSYLDPQLEEQISRALAYVTKSKTTITIAHRLSTMKNLDEIWFLGDHKILEKGTFNQLLRKKGDFFRFFLCQFGGVEIFMDRLAKELDRAAKAGRSFSIVRLDIKNWKRFDKDPLAGNSIISDVVADLSKSIEEPLFPTEHPAMRGSFVVAMPETMPSEASGISTSIIKVLKKLNPRFDFVASRIFASERLTKLEVDQAQNVLSMSNRDNASAST